jgi:threonine dehydrogenase-like Zn-dependent dehydrogenase
MRRASGGEIELMAVHAPASAQGSTRALWYVGRGAIELRSEPLAAPGADEVLVRTLFSGVSRGTERLVLDGAVAQSEWQRMRAPLQVGEFPFPVKYGYCATGRVEAGTKELLGRDVFVLHPHQERFVVPAGLAMPIPDGVPARRATLAANMETALNAVWDAGAAPADRIVVVGAGIVGLLVGYLSARLPGAEVTAVDIAAERKPLAESLGIAFSDPGNAPKDADLVFHTTATGAGLDAAIATAGMEATIIELSWYGEGSVPVRLGGAFHSRRLKLISSQVGQVAASRRPRWGYRRRLQAALKLLSDPALDALLATEIRFDEAPARLPSMLAPGAPGLAPVIRYSNV